MTPKEHYHKVKELFQEATKLPKTKQAEFLKQVGMEFPSLVDEVICLLTTEIEEQQFNKMHVKVGEFINNLLVANEPAKSTIKPSNSNTDDFITLRAGKQKYTVGNDWLTSDLLKKGDVVNQRYEIEKEFQRGGFAIVYLAKDISLHNRLVILKVLNRIDSSQDWSKNKFLAEIKALSKLNHPNVVTIFDYGVLEDNKPFFVMEYIQGQSLRELIAKTSLGLLSEQVVSIINQISNALDAAHKLGIYHRDLKPENIMVQALNNEQQHIKVIDFGIATVKDSTSVETNISSIVGTPTYMSPEQLEGQPSAASDIYALGVIVYEMLTGRPPFNLSHFKDVTQVFTKLKEMQKQALVVKASLLNPTLPAEVDKILLKALSYNSQDRYKYANQLAQALNKILFSTKADILYWEKLCSLAQPIENIKVIDQDLREKLKVNSSLVLTKQTQYNYPLHSHLSILLDLKQTGHLLLIAKDIEESEGLAYCLCPSHFAASDKLTNKPMLLPTEGLVYKYFPLADKGGKKQILAIVSHSPIKLDWKSSIKMPIQILTTKDIYSLLVKLQKLAHDEWTAFSTTINIT